MDNWEKKLENWLEKNTHLSFFATSWISGNLSQSQIYSLKCWKRKKKAEGRSSIAHITPSSLTMLTRRCPMLSPRSDTGCKILDNKLAFQFLFKISSNFIWLENITTTYRLRLTPTMKFKRNHIIQQSFVDAHQVAHIHVMWYWKWCQPFFKEYRIYLSTKRNRWESKMGIAFAQHMLSVFTILIYWFHYTTTIVFIVTTELKWRSDTGRIKDKLNIERIIFFKTLEKFIDE